MSGNRRTLRLLGIADCAIVVVGLLTIVAGTSKPVAAEWNGLFVGTVWIVSILFAAIVGVRATLAYAASAVPASGLKRFVVDYVSSPAAAIDLVAILAVPVPAIAGIDIDTARLFGLLWVFKFARYSRGLGLLGRVIRNAAEPLLSVLLGFVTVLIAAATGMYLLESGNQPNQFGSISQALWWAIATLTTTGYGDVVPLTFMGRVLAGSVMICGIGMFALWAGVLATGFADELRRREFLQTWDLVAKVPFFRNVGAPAIAAVARLLKHREMARGQIVMRRGQPGETMYFVVSGEVEVDLASGPVRLGHDKFFGEMALVTGERRGATVTAVAHCVLLELDVADFRQLGSTHPELLKVIAEEADRRRQLP